MASAGRSTDAGSRLTGCLGERFVSLIVVVVAMPGDSRRQLPQVVERNDEIEGALEGCQTAMGGR